MAFGDVIGYTYDGAVYCSIDCLPDGIDPDDADEVGVILDGQGEWDYVPCCDNCHSEIEDVVLTTHGNLYEVQRHLEAANGLWKATEQIGSFVANAIRNQVLEHIDKAREHVLML